MPTADGLSLLAWYLPPPPGERPVIVYFHGNGGHIGYRADRIERFAREGYGALMLEYRGYGGNPGDAERSRPVRGCRGGAALCRGAGRAGRRLVLYGKSLGTGVAVRAAATHKVGGGRP